MVHAMKDLSFAQVLATSIEQLKQMGCDTPELDARLLLQGAAGLDRAGLMLREADVCPKETTDLFEGYISRRISREPVFRILGAREFHGLLFQLGSETLEPRDDTECLIEAVLEQLTDQNGDYNFLDLGTGTGAVVLSLLSELPSAKAIATDISQGAIEVANSNAISFGFTDRLKLKQGSWFSPINGQFNFIVSNPPYIDREVMGKLAPEVLNHDPLIALDGGEDGLEAYCEIFKNAAVHLKPSGFLALEIGFDQLLSVTALAKTFGWVRRSHHSDLSGQARAVVFAQ